MDVTGKLIRWYDRHRRDLPWRSTKDPYKVWVSEIMLQQTRVGQGLDYYLRFVARFPDMASLAAAKPDEVMKLWQGLGYYSRARNMMEAARQIMSQHGGRFPASLAWIRALRGIGPYTAAAIASICFNEPSPVVDGNVIRFLSRLYGMDTPSDSVKGKQAIHKLAAGLIDHDRPGDFNQALMEFGALYCKPRNPDCPACIFRKECVAFKTGRVGEIPVKEKAAVVTARYFHYFVAQYDSKGIRYYFLKKRKGNDIWQGLYEFPLIETDKPTSLKKLMQSDAWTELFGNTRAVVTKSGKTVKHQLSHRVIYARFCEVQLTRPLKGNFLKVAEKDLMKYPFSRLIERFFFTT